MRSVWVGFPAAPYTHQSAVNAAEKVLKPAGWTIYQTDSDQNSKLEEAKLPKADVYFGDYDLLPFEDVHPVSGIQSDVNKGEAIPYPQLSSYVIRKSLIRKNYLAHSLHLAKVKKSTNNNVQSNMQKVERIRNGCTSQNDDIAPATWIFEATSADDLDELLADDLYDVKEILESEEDKWFILKPAMADQGMGIRLFNSVESLEAIFEEFEEESDDEEEEEEEETIVARNPSSTAVVISQVRQFVIQEYLQNPLVIQAPTLESFHKFHIRAYVLAQGNLRVFLYDEMLALFAPKAYSEPKQNNDDDDGIDLSSHLTNTSRQDDEQSQRTVHLLSDLEGSKIGPGIKSTVLTANHLNAIRLGSAATIAEAFEACTKAGRIHFQPWPNAWEIFGIDLMVTVPNASDSQSFSPEDLRVWLLEINAQPDFAKSGPRLQEKIDRLFERALEIAVLGQDGTDQNDGGKKWEAGSSRNSMTLCLDIPMSSGGW